MSFNPGGGGGISNASDVVLSNPTTDQALSYDGATQKWKNAAVTKAQVGLANVDNTSDANKPVSSATQTALNAKVDTTQLGVANGVATLGSDGKLPSPQAPAIDDSQVAVLAADTQTATGAAVQGIAQSVVASSSPFNFAATVGDIPAGAAVDTIWVIG